MTREFRRTLLLFLTGLILAIGAPALTVIIFDPFFVLHKKFSAAGFDSDDRYQNAGIIRSFLADPEMHMDTIIIGTSMSQNLPVSVFKNAYGVHALKLTLSGGKPRELAAIVKKAIATGRVRKVIWEVHTSYMYDNADALHEEAPLPLFLYNDYELDDWRYIFNNDVLKHALKIVKGEFLHKNPGDRRILDDLYGWKNQEQFARWSSPENLKKLHERLKDSYTPITQEPPEYAHMRFPNIEKNLLPILRNNPDIEFDIYYPPVSYYDYADSDNGVFWQQMAMRKQLLEKTKDLKNVWIYGFDFIPEGPQSVRNYMDRSHYTPQICARLARYMVRRKYILRAENYDAYAQKLKTAINNFAKNF